MTSGENRLEFYRESRSSRDAPYEPVESSAVDPLLDVGRDADGRWMDVVQPGGHSAAVWRALSLCSGGSGGCAALAGSSCLRL